jgi:hypothetical protein
VTLDELTHLAEQLLVTELHLSVSTLRAGAGEALANVDDDVFLLAVRFLAGERVTAPAPVRPPAPVLPPEEIARRQQLLDEIEHEDDEVLGPVDIGDGVSLF